MRRKYHKAASVIIAIACLSTFNIFDTNAQVFKSKKEELTLDIQIRPRAELRNGVFTPILENTNPATFISQRSRLGVTYAKDVITTCINLQMLNVWGNEPQVQRDATSVGLYEAWGQLQLSQNTKLRFGRQVFSYDDERILGALDWNQAGRKHDAGLFVFEKKRFRLDIAAAFNQNSEMVATSTYDDSASQPYKSMQFVWAKYKVSDAWAFSALLMNLYMQNRVNLSLASMQTMGINGYYAKNKVSATSSFYYQLGNNTSNTATIKSRNAYMAALYIDYNVSKKLAFSIGSDYLSGRNMNSTSNQTNEFNPLYGTHHKFYGYMDHFYVGNPHRGVGLWDNYCGTTLKVKKKTAFALAYHHFNSAAQVVDNLGYNMSSNLGDEVDLTFSFTVDKSVKLVGGYSQMIPSSSLKIVKGIISPQVASSNQSWVWLSLIINPNIVIK